MTTRLGVNIDHVATIRQVRGTVYPDPIRAALQVEAAGCFSIVAHLREDRRHIQDEDIRLLKCRLRKARLNLEMAVAPDIVSVADSIVPYQATLVPEKRKELTTEGGLDLINNSRRVGKAVEKLRKKGIIVSLFIGPQERQVKLARLLGADMIEFHTGEYAEARSHSERARKLLRLVRAVDYASESGFNEIAAGHGLHYANIGPVARISRISEFNIGHSIIAESVFVGLSAAVKRMMHCIEEARG